ncbi:MAG: hypothetical protein ACE5R6_07695 [Candidatus Heimdallarchaeota archaeon]
MSASSRCTTVRVTGAAVGHESKKTWTTDGCASLLRGRTVTVVLTPLSMQNPLPRLPIWAKSRAGQISNKPVICPGTYTEAVFTAEAFIRDPSSSRVFVTLTFCILSPLSL